MPWESRKPQHDCGGFKLVAGLLELEAGYADFGGPVLLYIIETINGTRRIWRRVWTHRTVAHEEAEGLVGDAEEYVESLQLIARPVEDLDLDDYIQHITERYQNGLH